ncbi:MAG: 4-hydroxy-tetrahydrodipicolinate synthase, partial [Clostridiales bacterium]|nr:4-hydroxy-tetrahydrodipicolinate synthase [Clostridiales bacterium]
MKNAIFIGSATAAVTPFLAKGGVDFEAFAAQLDYQIQNGADALVVLGTTGEASVVTADERAEILHFAVKHIKKRVPLIAGTGSNCTAQAVEWTLQAQKLGADAALLVTPYYNKCTQKGLIAHFSAVAKAVALPLILYNVPGRTNVNLLPSTVHALTAHKNVAGIKEASGNLEQIGEIARLCGDALDIYSGDDALTLPVLSLGGAGVISTVGNLIPRLMRDLCANFFKGKLKESLDIQLKILPLIRAAFKEVNPIPVKAALNAMGLNAGVPR